MSAITPEDLKLLREHLIARFEQLDPNGDAAVALSGGVDSMTVLFAALAAGRKPTCYTFHVDGIESSDLRVSKEVTKVLGLKHEIVTLPSDEQAVRDDVDWLIHHCDWPRATRLKKIIIQCSHPWLHILPRLHSDRVIVAVEADSMFRMDRKSQEKLRLPGGEEKIRKTRHSVFPDPVYSSYHIAHFGRTSFDKQFIDLFDDRRIAAWYQRFTHQELNKHCVKFASVGLFPEFWRRGNWLRDPSNYQINSRLRETHAELLADGADRSVIAVYNQAARDANIWDVIGTDVPPRDDDGNLLDADGFVYGQPRPDDVAWAVSHL